MSQSFQGGLLEDIDHGVILKILGHLHVDDCVLGERAEPERLVEDRQGVEPAVLHRKSRHRQKVPRLPIILRQAETVFHHELLQLGGISEEKLDARSAR